MYKIDFFELSFLIEACIPPRPIARAMFWDKVITEYYHLMSEDERERLFGWIIKNPNFNIENNECALFHARFNPENQYEISTVYEGEERAQKAFLFNGDYRIDKDISIIPEYIVKIKQLTK